MIPSLTLKNQQFNIRSVRTINTEYNFAFFTTAFLALPVNDILARGVFRGALCHAPPFGSTGLQNCRKKYAQLRHGPLFCKLGIRFDYTKGIFCAFLLGFMLEIRLNLSEDLFFLLLTWFWAKDRTKFEWRPFFFALHLILGEKSDWFRAEQFLIQTFALLIFSEVSGPPPLLKIQLRYWF